MEGDHFQFSLGPPNSGFSMFLADRTKKVHFIRHAEGFHNVSDMALWDARLTPAGIEQCKTLRAELAHRPSQGRSFTHFDLVVISPLTRTLETANHIFGPPRPPGVPSFLAERFGERNLPRPKFLVREECRERWGLYTCDGRRPITDIIREFPDFDFSEVENNEDHFWEADRGMHMA
jgi:broad specificity phosphatase PhoE